MSLTGYYNRVDNTVVSGSQLYSYLSGSDLRELEFDAAVHSPPVLAPVAAGVDMTAEQIIQAATASLGVNVSTSVAAGLIDIGADTTSQSGAYISLFNLRSTNDVRNLRFHLIQIGSNGTINLGSNGTSTYIQVTTNQGAAAGQRTLYDATVAVGGAAYGAIGVERLVQVSATDLDSGNQVVVFNILNRSN